MCAKIFDMSIFGYVTAYERTRTVMEAGNGVRKRAARLWSDDEFCARVVKRCAELQKSQRDVLKEAGVAHDYLQTDPAHGRRIDRVARVAEALDWSLPEILGIKPPAAQIDPNLALIAAEAACEATQEKIRLLSRYVEVLTAMYNHLLDDPDSDPAYIRKLARYETKRSQAALSPAS
jgi:hypothetical protein